MIWLKISNVGQQYQTGPNLCVCGGCYLLQRFTIINNADSCIINNVNSLLPNSDLNWRKEGKPLDYSGMT